MITLMSVIFFLALFTEHYETGDDFWINSIASGFTTERDYHLVFNNILLGHLLVFLNTNAPSVPWYGLLQYLTAFLSLSSVVFLLLREKIQGRLLLIGLVLSFFTYELFIKAEFTKVSGIAAATGILLVLYALEKDSIPKVELSLGLILLFVSSLYRFAGFMGALAIWVVYGFFHMVSMIRKKNRKIWKRYLIIIPLSLFVCLGIWKIDDLSYRNDPAWNAYKEFLTAEKTLNDFSYPEYSENEAVYKSADVNENARILYSHMDIADPEKYTVPVIQKIASAKSTRGISFQSFWSFLKESLPSWFRDYPYVYAVLAFFVVAVLCNRTRRIRVLLLLVGSSISFLFLEYALYLRGRYGLNRVDLILFYSLTTIAIILMTENPDKDPIPSGSAGKRFFCWGSTLAAFLICGILLYYYQPPHQHGIDIEASDVIAKTSQKEFYSNLNQDQKNTYLIAWSVSDYSMCFGPLDPIEYGSSTNQIYLGGWLIESPIYHKQLEARNIENPFRSLVTEPNVYLLQNGVYIESSLNYLNDYYRSSESDPAYYGVVVKNIGGNLVYKITTDELTKRFLSFEPDSISDGTDFLTSYIEIHPSGSEATISGSLYLDGDNSFSEQLFVIMENETGQTYFPFYLTQEENPFAGNLMHGQYSAFSGLLHYDKAIQNYQIWLIYQNHDRLLKCRVAEDRILQ